MSPFWTWVRPILLSWLKNFHLQNINKNIENCYKNSEKTSKIWRFLMFRISENSENRKILIFRFLNHSKNHLLPPLFNNWIFNSAISLLNLEFSASLPSWLTIGLFLILRARSAYLNVETVSSKFVSAGETQAIIKVCEFPPKESCKSRVNLESRYGICVLGPDSSPKAEITLPISKTFLKHQNWRKSRQMTWFL